MLERSGTMSNATDAEHQALRSMRDAFIEAYNRLDIDSMLSQVDENICFTAMNGEICHNVTEMREFFAKMLGGSKPVVKSTKVDALEVDRLTVLYDDNRVGVATGWADTSYKLSDGLNFSCRTRWSATMLKTEQGWKIVSCHCSANVFDNPILSLAKKAASYTAAASVTVGLAAGAALTWFLRRR